ncbi:MAG TPA: single-stranded-DNA-specific exonuclease RecJ, partial [Bacillota bacterium]|nr:single-stranded-DNA-specific exonuclease RecJ [Bacillota bacterium]
MLKAKYIWKLQVEGIVPDTEIFRNILTNRGIDDPDRFFSLGEESVYDPYLLKDMKKAATRIWKALSASEKILIYGDYDCDGISSISVLVRALRKL